MAIMDVSREDLDNAVFITGRRSLVPTGRGCGKGYVQGYEYDGQWIAEGVTQMSVSEFKGEISHVTVIDRIKNVPNRYSEIGERFIIRGIGRDNRQYFGVWWYGKDSFVYVEAQTLQLALEFERSKAYHD
jgi:hypothetical protein